MHLTVHDRPESFLAAAGLFLRRAEAENSIIGTPAARMIEAPHEDDAGSYFATVAEAGSIVGAAFHGSDGGALLSAGPDTALGLIAADLADRGRKVRHVVGPPMACEAFARTWRERTGQDHALRYRHRHLELARSPRRFAASGRMRELRVDEHDLILDWQAAFVVEVGMPDNLESVRKKTLRRLEQGGFRVWDDDGVVAFAGYGAGGDTARIAPVYTPPRFRCRGYASALVAELSRELVEGGKRALFLTTDVANPTSNSIYQKIGYRPVAEHVHLALVAATT